MYTIKSYGKKRASGCQAIDMLFIILAAAKAVYKAMLIPTHLSFPRMATPSEKGYNFLFSHEIWGSLFYIPENIPGILL